ncbi:hypothetical protein HZA38_00740 [Candidatus Peregrinibacteria bacterium]|nr:hypothetical protein [Candidatus Peregrinibacteria bacterium]
MTNRETGNIGSSDFDAQETATPPSSQEDGEISCNKEVLEEIFQALQEGVAPEKIEMFLAVFQAFQEQRMIPQRQLKKVLMEIFQALREEEAPEKREMLAEVFQAFQEQGMIPQSQSSFNLAMLDVAMRDSTSDPLEETAEEGIQLNKWMEWFFLDKR